MGTYRHDLPLFAGTEDTEDLFLSTMEEVDKDVAEVIDVQNATWNYLKRNNLIEYRDSIGTEIKIPIMDEDNPTVKAMTGYDDVDNTPTNALDWAIYQYGQFVGTQMYNREELVKNSGREQIIDLVAQKTRQLEISLSNFWTTKLLGTQVADGRVPNGLGNLVARDTASGGINPTATGKSYWNPQITYKTGTTPWVLATEAEFREGMRTLYRRCMRYGAKPDVLICGEDLYDRHQEWAESKLQMTLSDLKSEQGMGNWEMFRYNGTTIIYEDSLSAKVGWAINFRDGAKVRIHRGTNFSFEPWQMLPTKVAKKRDLLLYAAIYAKDRRCLGTITFS
jgi:hypothetical protein